MTTNTPEPTQMAREVLCAKAWPFGKFAKGFRSAEALRSVGLLPEPKTYTTSSGGGPKPDEAATSTR